MDTTIPKEMGIFLACVASLLWLINEGFKLAKNVRAERQMPPNEMLAANDQALAQRVKVTEEQIAAIWTTFRAEDQSIREDINASVKTLERGLGRVEGVLENMVSVIKALQKE